MAVKSKHKYRNKKTGAVIETTHKITGSDWEKINTIPMAKKPKQTNDSGEEDE